jgi:hypothetical protein
MAKRKQPVEIVGMYEVLEAVEAVIIASDPAKRAALAQTIDRYHEDFPEEFHWAVGERSPALLYHLFNTIASACSSDVQLRPRPVIRLVDRKSEGNA